MFWTWLPVRVESARRLQRMCVKSAAFICVPTKTVSAFITTHGKLVCLYIIHSCAATESFNTHNNSGEVHQCNLLTVATRSVTLRICSVSTNVTVPDVHVRIIDLENETARTLTIWITIFKRTSFFSACISVCQNWIFYIQPLVSGDFKKHTYTYTHMHIRT